VPRVVIGGYSGGGGGGGNGNGNGHGSFAAGNAVEALLAMLLSEKFAQASVVSTSPRPEAQALRASIQRDLDADRNGAS